MLNVTDMEYKPDYKYIPPLEYHVLTPVYDWACSLIGFGRRVRERILSNIELQPHDVVLDIGCGTGVFFEILKKKYTKQNIIGVDPDAQSLDIARRRLIQYGNARLIQAYGEALPLESKSVDYVISTLALHYMPNEIKKKCIEEMHRVLKPGGKVIITDFGPSKSLLLYRLLLFWEESEYLLGNLKGAVREYVQGAGFRDFRVVQRQALLLHFFKIMETIMAVA